MKTSETINEFAAALSKAQGEMKNPETNRTVRIPKKSGGEIVYNYCDLPTVLDSVRACLAKNGLAHSFSIDVVGSVEICSCRITHASGQWMESSKIMPRCEDIKDMAGNITYLRRYLFSALVGVASDDDTDSVQPEGSTTDKKQLISNPGVPNGISSPIPRPGNVGSPSGSTPPTATSEPKKDLFENANQFGAAPSGPIDSSAEPRLAGHAERMHIVSLCGKGGWDARAVVEYTKKNYGGKDKVNQLTMPEYNDLAGVMAAYQANEVLQ
jgi:hypothetical protein